MKNISILNFHDHNVRIQLSDNEPLFCLKDVADILNITNAKVSRFRLSDDGVHKMYISSGGQKRELAFINEPNLYRVIFRSNKKEAIEFQNWVFDEVLPTIRKTGSYSLTITAEQQQRIKKAVNERSFRTGEHYQKIYVKLYDHFKIPKYQDLPSSKFNDAIMFLSDKTRYINQDDVITVNKTNLNSLVSNMIWLNKFYQDNKLYQVFKMLGSDFGFKMGDHFQSGSFVAGMFKKDIEAMERF